MRLWIAEFQLALSARLVGWARRLNAAASEQLARVRGQGEGRAS